MRVLQVRFKLKVSPDEYEQIASSVAQAFAAVRGLRWKLWTLDRETGEAGGVYLFEDESSLQAFLAGSLAEQVRTHAALRDLTVNASDVMAGVSLVTRAPIGGLAVV